MKVLHVIDNLKVGGTTNLADRTIHGLIDRGVDVSVCVLTGTQDDVVVDDLPVGTRFLNVHGDYRKPFALRGWARQVGEIIADVKPDIVHSWLWVSDVVAATAAARIGVPHLVHVVDRRTWQESNQLKHRYRRMLTQRAFRSANSRFLAVSRAAADFAVRALKLPAERMSVAVNSIEPAEFNQVPDSAAWSDSNRPLQIGIAARIEPEKGHIYLLQAVRRLRDDNIPVHLKITGNGTSRAELEGFVKQHHLSEHVEFVGWVDSVTGFLGEIDVFAVPSVDSEGLPTTILEAMAAGRVVVASDVGGAGEAIRDNIDGRLVRARDVDELTQVLNQLAVDRDSAKSMSASARQRITDSFSMPHMLDVVKQTYAKLKSGVPVHA